MLAVFHFQFTMPDIIHIIKIDKDRAMAKDELLFRQHF